MNATVGTARAPEYPVAIRDKDLGRDAGLIVETYEICTLCGQCFGIGYLHPPVEPHLDAESQELPEKLKEILCKDHRHNRQHKQVIELDE